MPCPYCSSNNTIKKGRRKRKFKDIQQFQCKGCKKFFSPQNQGNKTYPIKIIANSISAYNLGCTLKQVSGIIEARQKLKIPVSTISSWLNHYKQICTFARLRKQALKQYSPKNIISKKPLSHIQPYTFKYHKAKLNILTNENPKFNSIKNYIEKIISKEFPHHIFTYNKGSSPNSQRASQLKFNHLKMEVKSKNNFACKLAALALNLATTNKERHQAIQDFLLINDSTTIAVEVPVYLTNWDSGYYRNQKGFIFPLNVWNTNCSGQRRKNILKNLMVLL